jgi:N-acetylglucosaminyl-diphospho-decaprenol L-rhamnosyltransferase
VTNRPEVAGGNAAKRHDLSVVIVSWNTRELLGRCLASVDAERLAVDLELIVVDNGSSDGSREGLEADAGTRLIANPDNRGFSAANNQGIAISSGRYVLLLNSDTEVQPGSLRAMVEYGDAHPRAGVIGPRLSNPDGTLQPSGGRFPTLLGTIGSLFGLDRLSGRPRYGTRRDYSVPAVVDEVSGAALLVRSDVLAAVGGLDEEFHWGYEDVDFCRRVRAAGWEVHFLPAAEVTHVWGGSRRVAPASALLNAAAGRRHYFRKHHGPLAGALVTAAAIPSHFFRSLLLGLGSLFNRRLRARAAVEWEVTTGLLRGRG